MAVLGPIIDLPEMAQSSLQFVKIQEYVFNLGLVVGFRKSRHDRSLVVTEFGADPVRITLDSQEMRDRVYDELCAMTNLIDLCEPGLPAQ